MKAIDGTEVMDAATALKIVLDLAKFAAERFREDTETFQRNAEAIAIAEDIAVNQFDDD